MKQAITVAFFYLLLGLFWFWIEDTQLFLDGENDLSFWIQIAGLKHYIFVMLSAAIVFFLTSRAFKRLETDESMLRMELKEKNAMLDFTNDVVWSIDTDLKLRSFNKAFLERAKFISGRTIRLGDDVLLPELGEEFLTTWGQNYKRALKGEKIQETILTNYKGAARSTIFSMNPIYDKDKVIGVSCFAKNVTQEAKTLEALEESQKELARQLNQYNALINTTLSGMFSIDQEERLVSTNEMFLTRFKAIFGRELAIGDKIVLPDSTHPFLLKWKKYFTRVLSGESIMEINEGMAVGEMNYLKVSFNPIFEGETVVGGGCFIENITSEIRAQKALEASEKKSRSYLERITSGYVAFDNDWNITYINQYAADDWGKGMAECEGKNVWKLFPELVNTLFFKAVYLAKENGSFHYQETYFEPNDTWYADYIYPNEDGLCVFFHIITEKKETEEKLITELREKNALMNSTTELIWSIDRDMKLRSFNDAYANIAERLLGHPQQPGDDAIKPQYDEVGIQAWTRYYQLALQGETLQKTIHLTLEGEVIYGEIALHPIYQDKKVVGVSCFAKNVTAEIQAFKELERSQKQLAMELREKNALINNTNHLIWSIDDKMYLRSCNAAFSQLVKQLTGHIFKVNQPIFMLDFKADYKETWRSYFERALQGEKIEMIRPSQLLGATRHMEYSLNPIFEGLDIVGVSCFAQDVSERIESEIALRNSEARYRQDLERISDAFVSFDNDWNYTYINQKAAKVWGKEPDELLGKNIWQEFPEGIDGPFYQALHKVQQSGQAYYQEEYHEPWDTWFADYFYPDENGVAVFFHDITQQKKAKETLANELREKNALINNTQDLIWSMDQNMKLQSSNEPFLAAVSAITGSQPQKGEKIVLPLPAGNAHDTWYRNFPQALQGERIIETRATTIFGQTKHLEISINPIFKDEMVIGLSCFAKDVTPQTEALLAQKEADRQLRIKESLLVKIYESSNDGMGLYELNEQDQLILVTTNKRSTDYFSPNKRESLIDYIGMELPQVLQDLLGYSKEQSLVVEQEYRTVLNTKKTIQRERVLSVENGENRYIESSITPVLDESGKCTHILFVGRDLTEQKIREKAIVQSQQQLRLIYDATIEMVLLLRNEGEEDYLIESVNLAFLRLARESMPNISRDEIQGKYLRTIISQTILIDHKQNYSSVSTIWKRLREEQETASFELFNFVGDKMRAFELTATPIIDTDGNTTHILLVIYEQTDRLYQAEQSLISINKAVEKERLRIASDLHDSLTQTLSVASINLKNLHYDFELIAQQSKYQKALKYLEEGIEESRSIAHQIMPKTIRDFGLIPSLQELIEATHIDHSIEINFEYNRPIRLKEEIEINLYRIVQQALANILTHAEAKLIEIKLLIDNSQIELSIKDDGSGFLPDQVSRSFDGIGIRTMRSRAIQLGGVLNIESSPQTGSFIFVSIPTQL